MLDIKAVVNKMNERGFTEMSRISCREDNTVTIVFCTMKLDGTDISCKVNINKETFSFLWCVPNSINKLSTPTCSPFFDDTHFYRIYNKILQHATILNGVLGE